MKNTIKYLIIATIATTLLVGLTGCGKSNKTSTTTTKVTSDTLKNVPDKDDNGKKLTDEQKANVAQMNQDDKAVISVLDNFLPVLYTYSPDTIENTTNKSETFCLDPKVGLYGANKVKVIQRFKDSKEISTFVNWDLTEINYCTASYNGDNKQYQAAQVKCTVTYNSSVDGNNASEKKLITLGFDDKSKTWKIMTSEVGK